MKFIYHRFESLPKLAWCASVEKGTGEVHVYHGSWLEPRKEFFVEGAWDGSFEEGNFEHAYLMGSGGKIVDNEVVFCTACHTSERIHYIILDDVFFISPSLCFLLTFTNNKLDYNYISYHSDLKKMCSGIDEHVGAIPCKGNVKINICHYRNIRIDSNLNIEINVKNINAPAFNNYNEYKAFLTNRLEHLAKNACDESRNIQYLPISTISSGYDSPACSIIAKSIGCKEAVTFKDARGEEDKPQGSDSGKPIADILGISVREFDRKAYLNKAGFPEAEFVASGDMGQDFHLCAFEEEWQQRLVFLGNHGWDAWNRFRSKKALNIPLYRIDFEADSYIDFKFRVGFISCHLPFIGSLNRKSLYKITNSAEMKPYWLWTNYDRPIARRIIEEAGVPRSLFGQKKKATSVLLNRDKNLGKYMNAESYKSFEDYYRNNIKSRNRIKQYYFNLMFALYLSNTWITNKFNIKLSVDPIISNKYSEPPGLPSFLVYWGIEMIQNRYKIINNKN
ncbi:MAG: hypothetical protein LLG02_02710 [Pelosinus sp.]|nr:hypothetical protein [Pelosinus sp.]